MNDKERREFERRASWLRFMLRQSDECTNEALQPIFDELARIKRKLSPWQRTIPWSRPKR